MGGSAVNRRSRYRAVLLAAAAVVGVVCCGLGYYAVVPLNGIRMDRLEADLHERLPLGSSWEQAEAWFASHGISPNIIGSAGRPRAGLIGHVPNSTLLEIAEIDIELLFDDGGRLRQRVVRRIPVLP